MTEAKIFELLTKNSTEKYDFPKLQNNSTELIAKTLADTIYETLKIKSTSAITKRQNVLQFVHKFSTYNKSCYNHLSINRTNYKKFFDSIKPLFVDNKDNDLKNFLQQLQIGKNLETDNILEFYKKKNIKHQNKVERLELIKQRDQQKLAEANFDCKISQKICFYETNVSSVKSLLGYNDITSNYVEESLPELDNQSYREKQIKFAYALINLKEFDALPLDLEDLLNKLTKYDQLIPVEINFLMDFCYNIKLSQQLQDLLANYFVFIYEKALIELSTAVLRLDSVEEINEFFENLLTDKKFIKIKEICDGNVVVRQKLKDLLFQLYAFSFCNWNLLFFKEILLA